MNLAPIALFAYCRPEHTRKVLQALSENELAKESELFIFIDGPRENAKAETIEKIKQVKKVCEEKRWCKNVKIIARERNMGLMYNIPEGIKEILHNYNNVIVLEDDILPMPYFLKYMNDALAVYENEKRVFSISACNFYANSDDIPETFFIPLADCWGWATWKDRWTLFEHDAVKLVSEIEKRNLQDKMNLYGATNHWKMLQEVAQGKANSWAVKMQAIVIINDLLSLYPKFCMSRNIGIDNDGATHTHIDYFVYTKFANRPIEIKNNNITENRKIIDNISSTWKKLISYNKRNPVIKKLLKLLLN